jgi:hypothetical protein
VPFAAALLAIAAMGASFVLGLVVAADLFDQLPAQAADLVNNTSGFDWLKVENIENNIDSL